MKPTFRKLEVEDVRALERLVTESVESIESGLTVIDSHLLLGHATIDLVGLDSNGSFVLIALGFTADDEMLLRVLEAYSWCLDYPDTVRRLYPVAQVQFRRPPRVVFIAERLPESFLRKVKRISFPELDCLEFRYLEVNGTAGLCFDVVERIRRPSGSGETRTASDEVFDQPVTPPKRVPAAPAEDVDELAAERTIGPLMEKLRPLADDLIPRPPKAALREEPAAPRPEPTVSREKPAPRAEKAVPRAEKTAPRTERLSREEPARRLNEDHPPAAESTERAAEKYPAASNQLGLGDLRLPENGELSPQWRKFLNRTAGRFDQSKIRTVRDYLQREFPYCTIYDFYEFERTAQVFNIEDRNGKVLHLTAISEDFLNDHTESEIPRLLQTHKLADALRQAGRLRVFVTDAGLKIENR